MSDSPYQSAGGALKLKGVGTKGGKKNKKKKKRKENVAKAYLEQITKDAKNEKDLEPVVDNRTAAQKAFDRVRDKRQEERILEKAGKKHKDHVEEFNHKLDQLSEHFDIPKVSWTK